MEEAPSKRRLGDRLVSSLALGVMPMCLPGRPDRQQSIRTIHAALDAGISMIDTADVYADGPDEHGFGEELVRDALAAWSGARDRVLVATKGGYYQTPDRWFLLDNRPETIIARCEASLRALGVDTIDLYQHHHPDPEVPYADIMGAMKELRDEGKIRLAGISNASVEQIEVARSVLGADGVASVQNQFSPSTRDSEAELVHASNKGMAFLAWGPLGGSKGAHEVGKKHPAFASIARQRGVSPQQVILAWLLAKSPAVVPIVGARREASILDSWRACDLELESDELSQLGL